MQKILLSFAVLILGAITVFVLFNQSNQSTSQASVLIRTGKSYWPGQFWKEVAQEKGWFKEAGLNVQLVDTNADYYQSLQDMVDGKLEAHDFPPFDFMLYVGKGADLVGVINTDVSTGIDAIISRPDITSMQNLSGKRVAVPRGTFGEYLLSVALEKNGMSLEDVIIVDEQAEKTHEAVINGTADAAVTYEPYISETIKSIGAARLFDTSEVFGINSSVESFHRSFIDQYPEAIRKYVEVWHKSTTFIKKSPKESYEIIARNNNVSIKEVGALVEGDKILDLADNRTSFSYAVGYESLYGAFRRLNKYMTDNNLLKKELNEREYFDGQFIRNL